MIKHIVFVASEPERAIGLEDHLDNFYIITVNGNITESLQKRPNVHIVNCASDSPSTVDVLMNPKTKAILDSISNIPSEIGIMVFKNTTKIEEFCAKNNYTLLNEKSDLGLRFERKLNQYSELSKVVDCFPETIIGELSKLDFSFLTQKFGLPFVLQYDRGHTGSSTVIVDAEKAFLAEQKLFPHRTARISRFINGIPVTLNCCATKYGTITSGLCLQITGLKECTDNPGTTVGNDWGIIPNLVNKDHIMKIDEIAKTIGDYMYSHGYKGMFGCDLIVSGENIYLIEINARQTASVGMHTKLLLQSNKIPLSMFHIAEFAGYELLKLSNIEAYIKQYSVVNEIPFSASQLIVRNTHKNSVKINTKYETGVYNMSSMEKDYNFNNLKQNDTLIFVAPESKLLANGDEMFRIISKQSLMESATSMKASTKALVQKVLSTINFIE